jgi:hypothetical protein
MDEIDCTARFYSSITAYGSQCVRADRGQTDTNRMARRRRPNALSDYAALRADLPGTEGVTVKDFTLEREGGKSSTSIREIFIFTRRWKDE